MNSDSPVKIKRTAVGELLIGLLEPKFGLNPEKTVWLCKSQLLSRFGIEGSRILFEKAKVENK